jgi:hypothetical protein
VSANPSVGTLFYCSGNSNLTEGVIDTNGGAHLRAFASAVPPLAAAHLQRLVANYESHYLVVSENMKCIFAGVLLTTLSMSVTACFAGTEAFEPFLKNFCESAKSAPIVLPKNSRVKSAANGGRNGGDGGAFALERTKSPLLLTIPEGWGNAKRSPERTFASSKEIENLRPEFCTCGGTQPEQMMIRHQETSVQVSFLFGSDCGRHMNFMEINYLWYLVEAEFVD